jgi:predicted ArsR family transcriptional regulator
LSDHNTIPARVSDLIRASIHSIEELEVLLLLRKGRGQCWSAEEIASELRVPQPSALGALDALVASELVERVDTATPTCFRYLALDAEREGAVEELARAHAQNRIPVLMQISSNAIARVREGALKTFSDAIRGSSRRRDD